MINPSDIVAHKVGFGSWECKGGMVLHCRIDPDFNWCTLLDQGLTQYDFLNVYNHPEMFYKYSYPKCLDHQSFKHGSIHRNKTIVGNGTYAHHQCQANCRNDQYFLLQVRIPRIYDSKENLNFRTIHVSVAVKIY